MKIVIVEDEKLNAIRLERLVKGIKPDYIIVAVLDSITESVDYFTKNGNPDLILMDVRLSDGLSFEIFSQVKLSCPIIFTTAYDEYAVRAFQFNSIDYLLKPVESDDLSRAFDKLAKTNESANSVKMDGLLDFFQSRKDFRSRFLLPYRDGFKTLLVSDVVYFYSELKITRAVTSKGKMDIVPQTMEELEGQLDPKIFFRANRQFIVQIDSIAHVVNHFNYKLKVVLKQGSEQEIIVSREKAALLKSWLDY